MPAIPAKITLLEANPEHNQCKIVNQVVFQGLGITIGGGASSKRLEKKLDEAEIRDRALQETCWFQLLEIQNANERLEEQTRISDQWKFRAHRAEILGAALFAISVTHLLLLFPPNMEWLLYVGWSGAAAMAYAPLLAHGIRVSAKGRMRTVLRGVVKDIADRRDLIKSRNRIS